MFRRRVCVECGKPYITSEAVCASMPTVVKEASLARLSASRARQKKLACPYNSLMNWNNPHAQE